MREHEYRKTVLDSGLTVHTIRIPDATKNYYEVLVKSGSAVEREKTGVAHYLEHMFGYGSDEYGKKDLLPHFAKLGGSYNFTTGMFFTNYHGYALPHKTAEYAERIASVLTSPAFTREHVELERGPILSEELSARDALKNNTFLQVARKMYGDHRYTTPGIGSEEDIRSINYEDLREYYEGVYVASNLHIISVGDVDHDEVVQTAQKQFATLSQRPTTLKMEPLSIRTGSHLATMDISGADVTIGFVTPYEGAYKDSLDAIISQVLGQRLHTSLREEHNLVYGIGAYMDATADEHGLIIKTNADPRKLEEVLERIFETITEATQTIGEEEIAAYCAGYEEYLADVANDPRYYGQGLSTRIVYNREFASPLHDLDVARNIHEEDLRQGMKRILAGKPFMSVAANLEEIPAIEKYVNKLRLDLGIDGNGLSSNIKEEFNPKDP